MNFIKKLKGSILYRLLGTFLLILALIYMLGLYIHFSSIKTLKNEIYQSTTQQASFYLNQLAEEIERIRILQYDCLTDENLLKLSHRYNVLDDYERISSMWMLYQRLLMIKSSSSYIRNVSVHIKPIERTISTSGIVSPLNIALYDELHNIENSRNAQLTHFMDRLYLTTAKAKEKPTFSVTIELDTARFMDALKQFNTYDSSNSFLYAHHNDFFVSYSPLYDALPATNLIQETENQGVGVSHVNGQDHLYVYVYSPYLDLSIVRLIPEKQLFAPISGFYPLIWLFSVVAIGVVAFYSVRSYQWIHRPLILLTEAFRKVEDGDFDVELERGYQNEFDYLFQRFNIMVENLSSLIDQVYGMKILAQQAELKQLQSQINPHFLYNSLFIINTMARVGDENLPTFTRHLGEYFRFVTKGALDYVTLKEEVDHARNYTEIQQVRFSNRLTLIFDTCPEAFAEIHVPRLILQPIIENAFEHAIEKSMSNCRIEIRFNPLSTDILRIVVEDSGTALSDEGLQALQEHMAADDSGAETSGLVNVHRRLRIIYGENEGLLLARSTLGGLLVQTTIRQIRG